MSGHRYMKPNLHLCQTLLNCQLSHEHTQGCGLFVVADDLKVALDDKRNPIWQNFFTWN